MIKNLITHKEIRLPTPIDREISFDGGAMITETDKAGIITYANKKFRSVTGYALDELVGSPHSINCHPDMPKVAFKGMWQTIKEGKIWEGHVKNMCKDGSYYWVLVWVQPKYDENKNLIGYVAGRKKPDISKLDAIKESYKKLKEVERLNSENTMIQELFRGSDICSH